MLEIGKVDPVPVTVTDQGRLEQVLTNLVDNAIKFNNEGGWVRISLRGEGAEAVLSVADNGPGIPKSAQALIFEEFQHGTDARSRAKEGAGLGLAIAKRVMGVLGGRMWLESEPGRGSTFYVSLPLEPVAEQVTAAEAQQPGLPMNLGDTHERAQNTNH
jgi:signal transduction histidine kinase